MQLDISMRLPDLFPLLRYLVDQGKKRQFVILGSASWEGFALDCVCRTLDREEGGLYFWHTHAGAELDLFWQAAG